MRRIVARVTEEVVSSAPHMIASLHVFVLFFCTCYRMGRPGLIQHIPLGDGSGRASHIGVMAAAQQRCLAAPGKAPNHENTINRKFTTDAATRLHLETWRSGPFGTG